MVFDDFNILEYSNKNYKWLIENDREYYHLCDIAGKILYTINNYFELLYDNSHNCYGKEFYECSINKMIYDKAGDPEIQFIKNYYTDIEEAVKFVMVQLRKDKIEKILADG